MKTFPPGSEAARPSALPAGHAILYALLTLAVSVLLGGMDSVPVAQGVLRDPDSYMRLVRLQEALGQGRWFGDLVSRDGSGQGVAIQWSHLFDAALLLLGAPLRLALPSGDALFWAAAIVGPLCVGAIGLACAWAAAPLVHRSWLWTAPLAAALAPGVVNYGLPGGATHHGALEALVVAAWGAGGRGAFGDVRAGALCGLFTGLGIWVSPEAMPFGLMAVGGMALSWVLRPDPRTATALGAAGSALLGVVALGLGLDPPHGGLGEARLDRLSVVFLCLALIVGALGWLPHGLGTLRLSVPARGAAVGTAGAAGLALWLALFPGYLHGLAGLLTPEEAAAFFGPIQEFAPLRTPSELALFALSGSLTCAAALGLAAVRIRSRAGGLWAGLRAGLWTYAALCGAAGLALAIRHVRFSPYPQMAAAILLPVLLTRMSDPALRRWQPLLRPLILAAFVLAPSVSARLLAPAARAAEEAALKAGDSRCAVRRMAGLLAPHPGAVVLASVNDGPELLYRTRVRIVGSLYHTGIAGFMRLRAAWRARDLDRVPDALRATGADYVLACPDAGRIALVDGPETTLFDRLNRDEPPAWLRPVAHDPASGATLYAVVPDAAIPDAAGADTRP